MMQSRLAVFAVKLPEREVDAIQVYRNPAGRQEDAATPLRKASK